MSSFDSIPVSRIMSSPVKTVTENATIQVACKTMVKNDISSVIVANQSKEPSGIITERDIVRHLSEEPISFQTQASQIMNRPIVTIHPNGTIRDALQTMKSRNIRRLLVVGDDGKNMMGIVTDKNIFNLILKNESVAASFVSEQTLGKELTERFSKNFFADLVNRRI